MNKTILLVEDEAIIAMTETKLLKSHGYDVLTAFNAEKAIEKARNNSIDLILMDIDLGTGKMDGTEAAKIILNEHELPIVFLTGHSEKEMVDRVKGITKYGYVIKNSGDFVLIESITMAFELFYAHQNLQQANDEWKNTFNAIQDIVTVISKDHEILNINTAGCRALRLASDEIIGRKCYELIHGTNAPIKECPCTIALETGESSFTQYEEKGVYYDLSAWPIIDPNNHEIQSFVHIVQNVTDRRHLENVLHESEKKYHSLFNSIRDAILVADTDRNIIDCNPAFSDLFGYTLEEMKGKKTVTVYKDEEEFKQLGKALHDHKGNSSDFLFIVHYRKKDGTVFPGETNVFYLHDNSGNITGFIGLIRDVSQTETIN